MEPESSEMELADSGEVVQIPEWALEPPQEYSEVFELELELESPGEESDENAAEHIEFQRRFHGPDTEETDAEGAPLELERPPTDEPTPPEGPSE